MPYIRIETNTLVAKEVEKQISKGLSQILGKNEKWVMVRIQDQGRMTYSGSEAPCAYVKLESLGMVNQEEIAPEIFELLEEQLEISPSRIYIHMDAPEPSHYGWNGETF